MAILKFIFPFIIFLNAVNAFGQSQTSVKATVNKNRLLIGEPVELTVNAFIESGNKFQSIWTDTIPHFEFLEKPVTDSTVKENGVLYITRYVITSFDSGHWVIPPFVLNEKAVSDSIPMDVVFSEFNPDMEYHDIKEIMEVEKPAEKIPWWYYLVGGIIILTAVIIIFKKKKAKPKQPGQKANPFANAMSELELLKKEKPESKIFYSRLISIFRTYLSEKKGLYSLQKTTDDLVIQVREIITDRTSFDELSQVLRLSDFVKFAKYKPLDEDQENSYRVIKHTIHQIDQQATETENSVTKEKK